VRVLTIGEDVIGRDGRKLGSIERLLVDESAHRITHVEVEGHLIGVARLSEGAPGQLRADLDASELARQPQASHGGVGEPGRHWRIPSGYALGNYLRVAEAIVGQSAYLPPVEAELGADETPEIKAGSPVWTGDREIGRVTAVLTDGEGNLQELVVRHGRLGRSHRVPADRLTEVVGTNVHLDLAGQELEALPPYP
jgi:hypothetical protein